MSEVHHLLSGLQHLYNGLKLGVDEVDSVEEWKREGKQWEEVVNDAKMRGWLA